MFEPPEALPIHTLSKLHYLIHELCLTIHLSFLERLNYATHCHSFLSLNPTIYHLLNVTSTNLTLSPFLLKLPLIFSVFPLLGLCYRPYGLFPTLLTKKRLSLSEELCSILTRDDRCYRVPFKNHATPQLTYFEHPLTPCNPSYSKSSTTNPHCYVIFLALRPLHLSMLPLDAHVL